METKKLFWEDAYAKEFDAVVARKGEGFVVLDQTLFYPLGGGQVGDTGSLDGVKVTDTRYSEEPGKEGEITHLVEDSSGFQEGAGVHGVLDWDRRYKIMRLHTAAHVIWYFFKEFDADCKASSGKVNSDKGYNDYLFTKELTPEALEAVESKANAFLAKGASVKIWFEGEKRWWELPGFPRMPCGGTHVKDVSEVGRVALKKGKNAGGGRRRIEYRLA